MSEFREKDRRQAQRFDTDVKINFHVNFDINTNINYKIHENKEKHSWSRAYSAVSRNIGIAGLCFVSDHELKKGDVLKMEVFIPKSPNPVMMQGHVRWSRLDSDNPKKFSAGVRVTMVNGEEVERTIVLDPVHHIQWSIVLESVFGGFKENMLKFKHNK